MGIDDVRWEETRRALHSHLPQVQTGMENRPRSHIVEPINQTVAVMTGRCKRPNGRRHPRRERSEAVSAVRGAGLVGFEAWTGHFGIRLNLPLAVGKGRDGNQKEGESGHGSGSLHGQRSSWRFNADQRRSSAASAARLADAARCNDLLSAWPPSLGAK